MNVGGPAIQVTTLMEHLDTDFFTQKLVTGSCDVHEVDYLEINKVKIDAVRIKHLGRSVNLISDFLAFLKIRSLIKEFQPDIVHTHTFKAGLIGRLAAISVSRHIRLVHTFHGHLLKGYFGRVGTQVVIWIERILAKPSTRLITVGINVKVDLLNSRIGRQSQYQVINPGFPIEMKVNHSRAEFKIDNFKFVCGWFARLVEIKRFDRLLEIARLVKQNGLNDIIFLVVGDGENRILYEEFTRQQGLPVVFLGWRSNAIDIMNMCDIVICTSDNEGTPLSLIEAQLLGKPVVSVDVGSINEIVVHEKSGFVSPFDANSFLQSIQKLKNNEMLYEAFSNYSKQLALEKFTTKQFIDKHMALYRSILQ